MHAETRLFLRQLLTNPRQVSAIAPSSVWLARAMTEGLGPHCGPVVEFGPGTGRLTAAILARGVPAHDLTVFEMNGDFVHHLRAKFPGIRVHHGPAQDAPHVIKGQVSRVISGLPLLSMPLPLRLSILRAAVAILSPEGRFVQFTYGRKPAFDAATLAQDGLEVSFGKRVLRNLPPAQVMEYFRAASPQAALRIQ